VNYRIRVDRGTRKDEVTSPVKVEPLQTRVGLKEAVVQVEAVDVYVGFQGGHVEEEWRHRSITLEPLNPEFVDVLKPSPATDTAFQRS
jgi:hypothetical protein